MFCMLKKKKIYPAYVSNQNSNHEKKLSALLRGLTSTGAQPEFETSTSKYHERYQRWWHPTDVLDNNIIEEN